MNQQNGNCLAKFEYILEADTTLNDRTNVPVTYLNCRKWDSFTIKSNLTKLRHSENIYFSFKLEFLNKELDEIDWILWDKWAQNHIRPRAIEIEPQANIRIIYDKHESNVTGLVANRIDQLHLKIRFNCASSQFPYSSENILDNQSTTFRLVIESFSDETGIKFDSVTCLIKLFEHENAQKQFQIDQYQLVKNYVEILNPSKNSKLIMNKFKQKSENVPFLRDEAQPSFETKNSQNSLETAKIIINIFYLYLNDKNFTSMPFPLTFNLATLTMDKMKDKLFLPLIQKNVGDNYLKIENVYFRELKNAFNKNSSIKLSDYLISKVFKNNCGYKLELEPIKKSQHHSPKTSKHQTKPKILYEITNNKIGNNLEKFVNKNVNNFCHFDNMLHAKSKPKEHCYNLHIVECFIIN